MCCAYESTRWHCGHTVVATAAVCSRACMASLRCSVHSSRRRECVRTCVCMSRAVVCAHRVTRGFGMVRRVGELEGGSAAGLCGCFVVCAAQTLTWLLHRATERPQGQPRERGCIAREGLWRGVLLLCACFSLLLHHLVMWLWPAALSRDDAHTCRRRVSGIRCAAARLFLLDHCSLGFILLCSTGPPDVWCEVCLPSRRVV